MVETAFGPDQMIPRNIPPSLYPEPLPPRRLSDWLFVVWQDACGGASNTKCIKNLEWVIHIDIINTGSSDAALQACGFSAGARIEWPSYPGYQFDIPDEREQDQEGPYQKNRDGFNALVGCPNGWGTGYMLQQRHGSFGGHLIDQVNVFGGDRRLSSPTLMVIGWHIEPKPDDDDDEN